MRVARGSAAWARRGVLAAVLLGAAVIPGRAASQSAPHCKGPKCSAAGSILWTRGLAGSWLAESGVTGTVPAQGEAYVAAAGSLAVLGYGTSLTAYQERTGQPSWHATLAGFTAGAAIIGVRGWPGVVGVAVAVPTEQGGQSWREVMLSATSGAQIRSYQSAESGGVVRADLASTVIVGTTAVISYSNRTGRVIWRRATGSVAQAWMVSGPYLYVAETSSGLLTSSPVTSLRRIDLRSGAERAIRPVGPAFSGTFAAVVGGVALFSGTNGLWAYNVQSGRLLWHRASAVLELVDQHGPAVYVGIGDELTGLDAGSGRAVGRPARSVAASLYAISHGVALGLDQGALGQAWGYDMVARGVVWTSAALPWPHFFVDLTGLGGSVNSASDVTLLTTCAAAGAAAGNGGAARCLRPELVAIRY